MADLGVDIAIVGASLAGCSAARLFAAEGLSVALIERRNDLAAHKKLCGHFIQPSAVGVIERLGLASQIEAAGGIRTRIDLWTPWGPIPHSVAGEGRSHGYAIRRSRLDPMLRGLAIATPGVTYLGGRAVTALMEQGGAIASNADGEIRVRASLVVGADGRNSTVAELSGAKTMISPNARFCSMAYFTGVDLGLGPDVSARLWTIDGDAAIASRNEDGVTILALFLGKERLESFRGGREAAFLDYWRALPDAPRIGERVSGFVGYADYPVQTRDPIPCAGVALIGDAAHAADPLWAIGCGWAFQTAAWLVDAAAPALCGHGSLAAALGGYARKRKSEIGGHQRFLALAAASTRPNPIQKLMFSAAVNDRRTARLLGAFASREISVRNFLSPAALARAVLVNLQRWLRSDGVGQRSGGRGPDPHSTDDREDRLGTDQIQGVSGRIERLPRPFPARRER